MRKPLVLEDIATNVLIALECNADFCALDYTLDMSGKFLTALNEPDLDEAALLIKRVKDIWLAYQEKTTEGPWKDYFDVL